MIAKWKQRQRCVSCGRIMEVSESGCLNHHCSPQHEAARAAANRRGEDTPHAPRRSLGQRLYEGFSMLRGA